MHETTAKLALLRLLADGEYHSHNQVRKVLGQHMGAIQQQQMLAVLLRENIIAQRANGYAITIAGMRLVPSKQFLPPMTPYRAPPTPPRRPGSEWAHLPSIHAGKPVPYQPHC